jgi:hypothetical protein
MHRLVRLATLPCILMSGCASTPEKSSSDGQPDYVAMEWCSAELIEKYRNVAADSGSTECGPDDTLCQKSAATIAVCTPFLKREAVQSPPFVHGRFVFGLSTNAAGRVSNLCLIDTNLGNTPRHADLRCARRPCRGDAVRAQPAGSALVGDVEPALSSVPLPRRSHGGRTA